MINVKLKLNCMLFKFHIQIIGICCTLRNNLLLGPQNDRFPFHSVLRKYILEEGCIDACWMFVRFDFLGVVKLPPFYCNQCCLVKLCKKNPKYFTMYLLVYKMETLEWLLQKWFDCCWFVGSRLSALCDKKVCSNGIAWNNDSLVDVE